MELDREIWESFGNPLGKWLIRDKTTTSSVCAEEGRLTSTQREREVKS